MVIGFSETQKYIFEQEIILLVNLIFARASILLFYIKEINRNKFFFKFYGQKQ